MALPIPSNEHTELSYRPIGAVTKCLPAVRLAVRRSAAAMMHNAILADLWGLTLPALERAALISHPPWKFYVDKTSPERALRVYGVFGGAIGRVRFHAVAVSAAGAVGSYEVHEVEGGVAAEDLAELQEWSAAQRRGIDGCSHPAVFYDPCGYMLIKDMLRP